MNVFVHLAYGFGATNWRARHAAGTVIGINEIPAYGYARAASADRSIVYSEDRPEGGLRRLVRLGVRAILGFDFVHAWDNRHAMGKSDIVWTHTESQYLSVLLLLALRGAARPKVLAQTVWLIDQWDGLFILKKWVFHALARRADVLTFHSPLNLAKAKALFPRSRCELVRFGIKADDLVTRTHRENGPIRILAVGSDRHRDWDALIAATGKWMACEVKIVSGAIGPERLGAASNLSITKPKSNADLFALYDWADMLIVTLKPNMHASGITVIEEAVTRALPVIASRVGGLDHYFADDEITFLPNNDPATIRTAAETLFADPARRRAMAAKAQEQMRNGGLNSSGYAMRHVTLSEEILGVSAS